MYILQEYKFNGWCDISTPIEKGKAAKALAKAVNSNPWRSFRLMKI